MAIPNPNPNIADGLMTDNLTWSSNKINDEISSVSSAITVSGSSVAGTTIECTCINHVLIIFHKYLYMIRRYSGNTIELLEPTGNVLASGAGGFSFGTLTATLTDDTLTIVNSADIQMSVFTAD